MEISAVTTLTIRKVQAGQVSLSDDVLAIEEPLELQLVYGAERKQRNVSVTMRTPGQDEELAAGFLFTEGIIQSRQEIASIPQVLPGMNTVQVILQPAITPRLQQADRNFYTTSSCGVCGKASIDAIKTVTVFNTLPDELLITEAVLHGLHASLLKQQAIFDSTGGLHASALFTPDGHFCMLREDVGRHNALDKLIGAALLQDQLPLHNRILLLSGRASFELIQKAAMAGIKVVAAVGAPSSLAVSLAQEYDMTLIGFLRNERFNIYCGSKRIQL
ncbi:formate dehydrogenase accessory sulfurtransferase FdhD [Pseudoflavitalea sp. X16]|uniref:formate dehydrogenase accessory sulfurtransferase FdhD n=1 Tax=Paraflavitalea devenefica TaxID=2716334 RepID=UPI001422CEE0|nr:formate dehydrogenase accessory sulfurtransferase FdhD [Paraflavitalea devenefica]NII25455.1 formate dehydrogenase accessory sulfurtransferase FdhD [Paraflavitalea devenefica]